MDKQSLLNLIKTNLSEIQKHGWFVDKIRGFLTNSDEEVDRLAKLTKKIAECPTSAVRTPGAYLDSNFSMDLVKDDMYAFYYELDYITNGKYKFLEKVQAQEPFVKVETKGRPSVGTHIEIDPNGHEHLVKHIHLSSEPLVNNRTSAMHELWHAINEKNYNLLQNREKNQFLGEIGTIFIDHIGREYLKNTYLDDHDFCDKLDKLTTSATYNADIDKARDGYLDYLVCLAVAGTPQQQNSAIMEVADNLGKLWGLTQLDEKLKTINKYIDNPRDNHYDPMYECRYLPAQAINKFLQKKRFLDPRNLEEKEKADKILAEQVSLMADLNNHLITLEQLNQNKNIISTFDIATNYLNVPPIEDLMSQYARTITQANTSTQQQNQNASQNTNAPTMI